MPDNPTNPFSDYAVLNAQTNMVLRYYKQVRVSEAFVIATPNTFYPEHIVYNASTEKLGFSQFFTKASGTTELGYLYGQKITSDYAQLINNFKYLTFKCFILVLLVHLVSSFLLLSLPIHRITN